MLESREAKPPGKGASVDSKGVGALCEAVGYLFQAISYTKEPKIRQVVEDKIIDYFKQSSPINAAKISSKIFEYMTVSSHGGTLARIVNTFLDTDTLTLGNISSDKLAFRIRLICGAVRECNGTALIPLFEKVSAYTGPAFTHHTEKPVRKAAHKLLKDILKGLTSIYPITVSPTMNSAKSMIVGEPVSLKTIEWHVPDKETLTVAVAFLRQQTTTIMQEVEMSLNTILTRSTTSTSTTASDASAKKQDDASKVEDSIYYSFRMLAKLIRGSAEILGDEPLSTTNTNMMAMVKTMGIDLNIFNPATTSTSTTNSSNDDDDGRQLHTARSQVILSLSVEDQLFVKQLRAQVLAFLCRVHTSLNTLATINTNTSNITEAVSTSTMTTTIANMTTSSVNNKYIGLSNSEPIRKGWCKLLKVLITRRSAWLRNADDAKKSLTMSKELTYCKLTEQIKHDLSLIFGSNSYKPIEELTEGVKHVSGLSVSQQLINSQCISTRMAQNICGIDYWKFHDANTNNIVNRVWVLYAKRQHEYAVSMNKTNSKSKVNPELNTALVCLINLCSHEYDVIRHQAIGVMSVSISTCIYN